MRLIAGESKGRRIEVPRGLHVRPSSARFRESAFGILEHRDAITDSCVLDLFAGSGILGLEALSRGARDVVAVEVDSGVARILRRNAEHCGVADRFDVCVLEVDRALARLEKTGRVFDLVFIDPPYRAGLLDGALERLAASGLVGPGGRVVVEHAKEEDLGPSPQFETEAERKFGSTRLTILRNPPISDPRGEKAESQWR